MFVLKATTRLGVNCEPGLYLSRQEKMESVVYQTAGFPQGTHVHYRICIKLLALYPSFFSLVSEGLILKKEQTRHPHSCQNKLNL